METKVWIPKPGEEVLFNGHLVKVISCNLGGKCKLKRHLLPHKGRVINDVDISELKQK